MNELFSKLLDLITATFGDGPARPTMPPRLPPVDAAALPPETPPDPSQPQDSADSKGLEPIIIVSEDSLAAQPPAPASNPEVPQPDPGQDQIDHPATPEPPTPRHPQRYLWCIDNGHGALTRGKRSPVMEDGRQLMEFEFNRDVTARIFLQLAQIGVAYFNVVPEVQVGNFLEPRARRANELESHLPKLFVSVHANAGPAPTWQDYTSNSSSGIETWYYRSSIRGRNMAAIFQRHLIERTGLKNRHLRSKVSGQFYVLRATNMPAILTENGFYNNRLELPLMMTDGFRQAIAEAHVAAILEIERDGI